MRSLAERLRNYYLEGMAIQTELSSMKITCPVIPEGLGGLMKLLGQSQEKGFARAKRERMAKPRNVSREDRPTLKDAMITLSKGLSEVHSKLLEKKLTEKGWMPTASKPRNYINLIFSMNPNLFKRLRRGVYRLKDDVKPAVKETVPHASLKLRDALLAYLPEEPRFYRGSRTAEKLKRPVQSVTAMLKVLEKEGRITMKRHKGHIVWARVKAKRASSANGITKTVAPKTAEQSATV
jgi:hypothetical protein